MIRLLLTILLLLPLAVVIGEPTPPATLLAWDKPPANSPVVKNYIFYCALASQASLPTAQKKYTIKKQVLLTDANLKTAADGKYIYALLNVVTTDGGYFCALTASNDSGESGYSGELNFLLLAGGAYNAGVPGVPSGFELR